MRRYFTVEEVNTLIPRMTEAWLYIMQLRGQLKTIYQRLDAKKMAPKGDNFDPNLPGAPADVLKDRFTFAGLVDVLKGELATVQALGAEVKDIETGLCDWYGKNGDRDVLLCWRFGEARCAFFHDLDTGFAGRRPVSELAPSPPPTRIVH